MKFVYFGIGDGSKGVCLDSVFNLNKDDCLVLSFGISKDWTFDEAFGKFGCKVVSLDPTIRKEDHQHSKNVRFLNLGISNKNESRKSGGWTINRYFGLRDGRKGVCLDPVFEIIPGQCRVLSFGICKEWSFDDAMGEFGCKVYSFDPTNGMADHQRSPNIRFYSLGIGRAKTKQKLTGMKKGLFKVDRYENILYMLGMTNTTIDYLKMDVEKSELGFFRDVFTKSPYLLKNVRQIGMELHHTTSKLAKHRMFWKYFPMLKCHGFKLLEARRYFGRTEAVWVRP